MTDDLLKLADMLRPKRSGVPLNPHVVKVATPVAPDYEAMRKLAHNQ